MISRSSTSFQNNSASDDDVSLSQDDMSDASSDSTDVVIADDLKFEIENWNKVNPDTDDDAVMKRTQMVVKYINDLLQLYLRSDAEKSIQDKRVVPLAREMVKVFKKFNLHLADDNDYVQVAVDSFLKMNLDATGVDAYKSKELYKVSSELSSFSTLKEAISFFRRTTNVPFHTDPKFPIAIVLMKIIDVAKFSDDDIDLEETNRRVEKLEYLTVLFAKTKHIPDDQKKQLCDMIDGLIVGGRCRYPKSTKNDSLSKFVSRKLARTVIQNVRQFFVNYIRAILRQDSSFDDEAVRKLQEVVNNYFESVDFDYLNRKEMKNKMYTTKEGIDLRTDIQEIGGTVFKGGVFRGKKIFKAAIRGRKKTKDIKMIKDLERGWVDRTHEVGKVVKRLSGIQQELKKDKVMNRIKEELALSNNYQVSNLMKHLGNTRYTFDQLVRGNRASPEKIAENFVNMFDRNKRKRSAFLSRSMFSYSPDSNPDHLSIEKSTSKLIELLGPEQYEEANKLREITSRPQSRRDTILKGEVPLLKS